jgi:hypothetical protein
LEHPKEDFTKHILFPTNPNDLKIRLPAMWPCKKDYAKILKDGVKVKISVRNEESFHVEELRYLDIEVVNETGYDLKDVVIKVEVKGNAVKILDYNLQPNSGFMVDEWLCDYLPIGKSFATVTLIQAYAVGAFNIDGFVSACIVLPREWIEQGEGTSAVV